MNTTLKNILAVILGLIIGSIVNMGIIMVSGSVIPPPEGVDATTMEGLKSGMHLFQPKHYIFPFLAHALGTLIGAFITFRIASSHKLKLSMVIGILFLTGGITNLFMLPSPILFGILDIAGAYIPMAWIGATIAKKI